MPIKNVSQRWFSGFMRQSVIFPCVFLKHPGFHRTHKEVTRIVQMMKAYTGYFRNEQGLLGTRAGLFGILQDGHRTKQGFIRTRAKKLLLVTSDGGMIAKVAFTTAVLRVLPRVWQHSPKCSFCHMAKLTSNVYPLTKNVTLTKTMNPSSKRAYPQKWRWIPSSKRVSLMYAAIYIIIRALLHSALKIL